MWQCLKCGEKVDENFDLCWNCGTTRDGVEDPGFRRESAIDDPARPPRATVDAAAGLPTSTAPPAAPRGTAPADRRLARSLVWILRGLAVLAAVWGLVRIDEAVEAARAADKVAEQFQQFQEMPGFPEGVGQAAADAAERAGATAVFTAALFAGMLVAALLALAEALRLCLLIEQRDRPRAQHLED